MPGGAVNLSSEPGRPDRAMHATSMPMFNASVTPATSCKSTAKTTSCTGTVRTLVPCISELEAIGRVRVVSGEMMIASRAIIRVSVCRGPEFVDLVFVSSGVPGRARLIAIACGKQAIHRHGSKQIEMVADLQRIDATQFACFERQGSHVRGNSGDDSRQRSLRQKISFGEGLPRFFAF